MDTGVVFYFLVIGPAAVLMFGVGLGVNAIVGAIVSARSSRRAGKSAAERRDGVEL
ncbi:MAG: hypothetical protein K0R99_3429 [Microbacterium sp.]|nr:hypothetical protein [Microbacterium sp.]